MIFQGFRMKRINKIICFLLLILSFVSCSKNKSSDKKYDHVIKLGFTTGIDSPRGKAATLFKNIVEKESNEKIKVEIYSDGVLGDDLKLIEGIINKSLDMTVSSAGNFASVSSLVGISALPFLFDDFEEAWTFMDSSFVKNEINKSLEDYNIRILSYFDNGFRCITSSNKEIKTVEDLKGLNIRTSSNQIVMEIMARLGAIPKIYPFPELKDALKKGMFDAQENPVTIIFNSKLYEEQKYLLVTNHSYDAMPFVIRNDLWENLSSKYKKIIIDAAKEASEFNRNLVKEQTLKYFEELKLKGMIINFPDLEEFKKVGNDVINSFTIVYGEDVMNELKPYIK